MGCIKMKSEHGISTRVAEQMREGILLGELAYNFKVKGDLKAARRVMLRASKGSKRTYLSALHTLANRLGCVPDEDML